MGEIDEVDAALRQLGRMMFDRDDAFAAQFAETGLLVGSEPGEIARGRDEIARHVAAVHALPARYIWDWQAVDITVDGDTAWLFAEGEAIASDPAGRSARPYRLSAVLRREGGHWRWLLFHGAEPQERDTA